MISLSCTAERQSQHFSPKVSLNDDCQPVAQCGQRNSDTPCTLQISTDPDQFDLNNNTVSTLNALLVLPGFDPNTTYYFQFSLQESDTLSIVEVVSLTTPSENPCMAYCVYVYCHSGDLDL